MTSRGISFIAVCCILSGCRNQPLEPVTQCRFLMPKEIKLPITNEEQQRAYEAFQKKSYLREIIPPTESILVEWDKEAGAKNPSFAVITCLEFGDPAVIRLAKEQRKIIIDRDVFRDLDNFSGFRSGTVMVDFCQLYIIRERSSSSLDAELDGVRFKLDIVISNRAQQVATGKVLQPSAAP